MVHPRCSGIRQEQYIGTVDSTLTLLALRLLHMTGKAERNCDSRQSTKCLLILGWMKCIAPGASPFANAVANATAKMPQSDEPLCICISIYLTLMASFGVASRAAIWFIMLDVRAGGRLSNTLISPALHPIVETVTQWSCPLWRTWINSSVWMAKNKVRPSPTSWRPLMWGNCLFKRPWAALMMLSVSYPPWVRVDRSFSV